MSTKQRTKRPRLGHTLDEIVKKRQTSEQPKQATTQEILSQFRSSATADQNKERDADLDRDRGKIEKTSNSPVLSGKRLVSVGDRSLSETGLQQRLVSNGNQYHEPETNYFKTPNVIADELLASLDAYEFKVYFRLFRLSHGFRSTRCFVGYRGLSEGCGLSLQHVKRVVPSLIAKGLITIVKVINTATEKGTIYEVKASVHQRPVSIGDRSPSETSLHQRPNKVHDDHNDDDDDHLPVSNRDRSPSETSLEINTHRDDDDEHKKRTKMLYEQITGNRWKRADDEAYRKIKQISIEKIEQALQVATERAASHPNSFNYFIKEIVALADPKQSKTKQKKALEKIVTEVRQLHTGEHNYRLTDLVDDVKRAAIRDGVPFDNDLFNKIIGL